MREYDHADGLMQGYDEFVLSPPRPMFVSQREFRQAIEYAATLGLDPRVVFPHPLMVHPDSLRWFLWGSPLGRLCMHFSMVGD